VAAELLIGRQGLRGHGRREDQQGDRKAMSHEGKIVARVGCGKSRFEACAGRPRDSRDEGYALTRCECPWPTGRSECPWPTAERPRVADHGGTGRPQGVMTGGPPS